MAEKDHRRVVGDLGEGAGQVDRAAREVGEPRDPEAPAVAGIDDLSGKVVHVRRASSYHESLLALNARFRNENKPEAKLVLVPDALEDEDMMEMLNVGLLQAMVADDWKAIAKAGIKLD